MKIYIAIIDFLFLMSSICKKFNNSISFHGKVKLHLFRGGGKKRDNPETTKCDLMENERGCMEYTVCGKDGNTPLWFYPLRSARPVWSPPPLSASASVSRSPPPSLCASPPLSPAHGEVARTHPWQPVTGFPDNFKGAHGTYHFF